MVPVTVFLVVLLLVALLSRRLVDGPLTPPTIMALVGLALAATGSIDVQVDTAGFRLGTEVTLSLVLFADATRIPLRALRSVERLPARLLGIGLPLSIALLTATAMLVLDLQLGPALLVGGALAATDAALARVIVTSEALPTRIRETVNVESGLNDGLATPVVTFAIALTAEEATGSASAVNEALVALGVAVVVGVVVGLLGGWALRWAAGHHRVDTVFAQLFGLALVGLVIVVCTSLGAITFVAAFLAGSAFGQAYGDDTAHVMEFSEDLARLFTLAAFFAFGLALLPDALAAVTLAEVIVVVVALTVARMLPVGIALAGSGLRPASTALVGWFGPRGLATVLFALIALEDLDGELPERAVNVMVLTVLASLVLHGASARPLTRRYARWLRDAGPGAETPEDEVTMSRTRW
ncbi:cation:proton antiporter [Salsipaludibacter albus]|uniref:cation:proton antiporter domain-containing protein n=1 Tax=Salsipaludibacter albus TaxID=2849650 RepID=UPI001EE4918A|nr:cation:proton antiporter [Salsipaludibacter albus]